MPTAVLEFTLEQPEHTDGRHFRRVSKLHCCGRTFGPSEYQLLRVFDGDGAPTAADGAAGRGDAADGATRVERWRAQGPKLLLMLR